VTNTLTINKAAAIVTLANLSQTYDGMAKTATVTTTPPGLAVDMTYNPFPARRPTRATIQFLPRSMTPIIKATRMTCWSLISPRRCNTRNLAQTYDGTFKSITVTTAPTNLFVNVTYDGTPAFPVNAGSMLSSGQSAAVSVNYQAVQPIRS